MDEGKLETLLDRLQERRRVAVAKENQKRAAKVLEEWQKYMEEKQERERQLDLPRPITEREYQALLDRAERAEDRLERLESWMERVRGTDGGDDD